MGQLRVRGGLVFEDQALLVNSEMRTVVARDWDE